MNAKILLRTVKNIEWLKNSLENGGFEFEFDEVQIKVNVPFSKIDIFKKIINNSMNAKFNYVNIKFPDEKKNVIVFPAKTFIVDNDISDEIAKNWALSMGLPKPESEWTLCYK